MAKEILLFEHNEKAYKALVSSLEKKPLAFIEHATGTGKSFIILKYLYNLMRDKRILFITSHYEMLEQLFNDQMQALGLSNKDFAKFDSIIYPNILDLNMKEVIENYDCLVWDEAHHCGAPKWSVKVNEAKELVKKTAGKVMIGATATRFRYLDNYMDVADGFFDGNIASVLPVTRAILKNLLPAPTIIITAQACLEQIDRLQKKLKKLTQTPIIKVYQDYVASLKQQLNNEFYVGNILKKYGVQKGEKYLVFCSNIKDIKLKMKEASYWFKDIGPVKLFQAHSNQTRDINIEQISSFSQKREEISLMFAVDIFNEGFHINEVNGIFIFRKTKSPNIYWQQLGRALSFLARKKEIKIYDFANNTGNNKVIYELYKEMIEEAKNLIEEDPENKSLYEGILSRFQIIDQTTTIMEKLQAIEEKINQKFIVKNRIDLAIDKLEQYRAFYPTIDFNKELLCNKLGFEFVKAYNYLCEVEDYLTYEQIERLQKLNISFTTKINLAHNKRKELLGESKTFKELEDKNIEEFITSYVNFCIKNNRRPSIDDDRELYLSYRTYLRDLNKNKLNRFLSQIPFRLTLEETIIMGNYPSKNDIDAYIEQIKNKMDKNIPLDEIEIKVLKKLSHVIPQQDTKLLEYLKRCSEINYKIDEAIITIKKYQNSENILATKRYKKALRTIEIYALRITNEQFALLLELGIKLPTKINMTMEKRLKELNGFSSFYEKAQHENNSTLNKYSLFLQKYRRRPSLSDEKEAKLEQEYEIQLYRTTTKKIREIANILLEHNLPLTFEEALLSENILDLNDVENYIRDIRTKLMNGQKVTKKELRLLRAIEKERYPLKIDIGNFIKMIININLIDELLLNYESGNMNENRKQIILRNIFKKSIFLTKYHIQTMSSLGILIPAEIIDNINKFPDYINYFEQEIKEQESFWNEFIEYLKTYKRYPKKDSSLGKRYYHFLSYASNDSIKRCLELLSSLEIPLGLEERILLEECTKDEAVSYLEMIKEKINNKVELSPLEARICRTLDKILFQTIYKTKVSPTLIMPYNKLENDIIKNIKSCIALNPYVPINTDNTVAISNQNLRKLETFRINTLGRQVFSDILKILKKEKKPLKDVLNESLQTIYNYVIGNQDLDADNRYLFNQIIALDREYTLKQKGLEITQIVNKYIEFIQKSNGERPNIFSNNDEERELAKNYEDIHDLLNIKDIKRIEMALRTVINEEDIKTFYPKFIAFINEFGRFPCGNSNNPYEVYLNSLYQNIGSTLSKEQSNEVKKLKKIYGKATILANMEFSQK